MADIKGQRHQASRYVMTGFIVKALMKVNEVEGSCATGTVEFKSARLAQKAHVRMIHFKGMLDIPQRKRIRAQLMCIFN